MNYHIFPKKIVKTKHYTQRQRQRAKGSNFHKDLSFRGISKIVYMPFNEKGERIIFAFTKGFRQYVMKEWKSAFLILTVVQHDENTFYKSLERRLKQKEEMERGL